MPTFSIIIPVYNTEKYIENCIDSVVTQTEKDWELILVDDGSTDKSGAICRQYAARDSRIKYISKNNEGVAIARKTGCNAAIGEYVAFVDSDDWIENGLLKSAKDILSRYDVDIVKFGFVRENADGSIVNMPCKFKGYFDKRAIEKEIFPILIQDKTANYYSPSICGGIFLREKIRPFMIGDSRARIGEDGACMIPCVYSSRAIYSMEECFYHYRYNPTSATKNHKVFLWDNPEVVCRHIEGLLNMNENDFQEQMNRKIAHDVFNVCVTQFYKNESFFKIRKEIVSELKRDYYKTAIQSAIFEGSLKANIMQLALRHHFTLLMYLFSKIK